MKIFYQFGRKKYFAHFKKSTLCQIEIFPYVNIIQS